nr:MAG TPA: hypothetical protein [Caudoviricetes sp.]
MKKVKFPLDKFKNLWYNKSVIKRGNLLNIKKIGWRPSLK